MRIKSPNFLLFIGIVLLLLISIPLGVYLYSVRVPAKSSTLTETEMYILNPPLSTASEQQKDAYLTSVQNNAQEGASIYIAKSCKMFPLILRVKQDTQFTIKNDDRTPHTITFTKNITYRILPGKQVTVVSRFPDGLGAYGYTCDKPTDTSLSGYIFIN